ncbi:MAG: energy transducer TonB [Flavobacteriaceae bacterium]
MKFESTMPEVGWANPPEEVYFDEPPVFVVEKVVKQIPKQAPKKPSQTDFEEIPNDTPDIFREEDPFKETTPKTDLSPDNVVVKPDIDEGNETVPFLSVEAVPIYPGCEGKKTNDDRRKCMSEKITKLVQKKFDTNLGSELGLKGKQVIYTQFKIDATGHVKDIQVRAPHPYLEKEAQRVINFIPEMKPGKQREKNVSVMYALPIIFSVVD